MIPCPAPFQIARQLCRPALAAALLALALPCAADSLFLGDLYIPKIHTGSSLNGNHCDGQNNNLLCQDNDGDGVARVHDQCPFTPKGQWVDPTSGCSLAQLCPCDGPRGSKVRWSSADSYQACLSRASAKFQDDDPLTAHTLAGPLPPPKPQGHQLSCHLAKGH